MDNYIYIVLSAMNCALGFLIAYTQISYYFQKHCKEPWCWLKLALGVMGAYWGVLYIYVMLQSLQVIPVYDAVMFGRIFVRPALTLTLGFIAAGGMIRWRSL